MIGRLLCMLDRHRAKRSSVFRGKQGSRFGECARCGSVIRLTTQGRWVKKKHPLSEADLDLQAEARALVERDRRRSKPLGRR